MWLKLHDGKYVNTDRILVAEEQHDRSVIILFDSNEDEGFGLTLHGSQAKGMLAYLDSIAVDPLKVDPKTMRPLPPTTDTTAAAAG